MSPDRFVKRMMFGDTSMKVMLEQRTAGINSDHSDPKSGVRQARKGTLLICTDLFGAEFNC